MKYYTHVNATIRNSTTEALKAEYVRKDMHNILTACEGKPKWTVHCTKVDLDTSDIPQIYFSEDLTFEIHFKDGRPVEKYTVRRGPYMTIHKLVERINDTNEHFQLHSTNKNITLKSEVSLALVMPLELYVLFGDFKAVHQKDSDLPLSWVQVCESIPVTNAFDMRVNLLIVSDMGFDSHEVEHNAISKRIADFTLTGKNDKRQRLTVKCPLINNLYSDELKDFTLWVYVRYTNGHVVPMWLKPGSSIDIALTFVHHK